MGHGIGVLMCSIDVPLNKTIQQTVNPTWLSCDVTVFWFISHYSDVTWIHRRLWKIWAHQQIYSLISYTFHAGCMKLLKTLKDSISPLNGGCAYLGVHFAILWGRNDSEPVVKDMSLCPTTPWFRDTLCSHEAVLCKLAQKGRNGVIRSSCVPTWTNICDSRTKEHIGEIAQAMIVWWSASIV